MADNSNSRKKALVVLVLAFLFIGGGVFLFFIVQGSEDLTGSQKSKFHYGGAARESVVSFFKTIGLVPDEEGKLLKYKEAIQEAREDQAASQEGVSDWMANNNTGGGASGSPSQAGSSVVPKMSGSGGSSGGGSGGGTKSSGGSSRFGDGNSAGSVNVSARALGGEGGLAGKGSLGALKNARAMLGDGLRSNSAVTARTRWEQSFGGGSTGGGSGRDPAYGKTGLVKLDKIKSGEIASLKTTEAPAAGAFERDKAAESKDPTLNSARKAKEDAEAEAKKAAIQAAVDAVTQQKPASKSETSVTPNPDDPPQTVTDGAEKLFIPSTDPKSGLAEGDIFYDTNITYAKNADGSFDATYHSIYIHDGKPEQISCTVKFSADGTPQF